MPLAAVLAVFSLTAQPPEDAVRKRAEELVARLGAPSYRVREKAARELVEIGYPAKDAVLAGQKSSDSEINDRCTKLYPIIWRADLEKRVQKFLDDPDGAIPEDLPGAARWLKITGESKESRRLYATTIRTFPEQLLEVELRPTRLKDVYFDHLRGRMYGVGAGRTVPNEAEVLLFLFLGAAGEVRPTSQPGITSTYIYAFLNSPALVTQLTADPPAIPVRKLYAGWLEKERYSIALRRGIDVAAQNKVHECGPAILKIAADPATTPVLRATALLGIGKLGTKDNLPALAPFLKEELQVAATVINGERGTVQMRDVAMAAAIQLAGQSTADFGFERRPPSGLSTVSYIYYAFTTDEKRAAAHAKWKEWAAANLKK